ncbi:hypothetical protein MPSEU_000689600 [Mayamaea pseudoterrestris]|nr:hypothetical protein MPSEU_000689600 [Mayamaea pseudoterrestris]
MDNNDKFNDQQQQQQQQDSSIAIDASSEVALPKEQQQYAPGTHVFNSTTEDEQLLKKDKDRAAAKTPALTKQDPIVTNNCSTNDVHKATVGASGSVVEAAPQTAAAASPSKGNSKTDYATPLEMLRKIQIVNLVCAETMPVFKDKTLPIPVPKIVEAPATRNAANLSMPRRRKYSKRHIDPLSAGYSTMNEKRLKTLPATTTTTSNLASTPVRANTTAARAAKGPEKQTALEVLFLEKYGPYLTYNWDELQLGTVNGSVAWNQALKEKLRNDPSLKSVPQMTPVDALQWVQRLQMQFDTIPPCEASDLRKLVANYKWVNERELFKEAAAAKNSAKGASDKQGASNSHKQAAAKLAANYKWVNERELFKEAAAAENSAKGASDKQGATKSHKQAAAKLAARTSGVLPAVAAFVAKSKAAASQQPTPAAVKPVAAEDKFMRLVSRAFQDCLLQDVTDFRPEYQCMRPSDLIERMRMVEQRAAALHERGLKATRESHNIGLWEEVGHKI